MKTQLKILILPFLFSIIFSSCMFDIFEEGNGIVTEEDRVIPEFSEISSSGSFHVYYEYDETPGVTVSGESNLLEYVETVVYNDELLIRTPFNVNIRPHHTIEVYVKGPYVDRIHLSGSGLIHTDEIIADEFSATVSGSGNIETTFIGEDLYTKVSGSGEINVYAEADYTESYISGSGKIIFEGESDQSQFKISGSGKIRAYDFLTNDADIHLSGSGSAYINVDETLSAWISGSGDIHYIGNPYINSNISGSGRLINNN